MAILYGVLRGRPDRFKREDNGSSPHLQIRVLEDNGQPWRIAVNVQSDSGSNVAFWVVDPLVGEPVLASLPGIQLVGPVKDSLGRPGTAFAVDRGDPTRDEIILDPDTGRLLGSRTTLTRPDAAYAGAPAGTVIGYETIVSTGVVDSTDARP